MSGTRIAAAAASACLTVALLSCAEEPEMLTPMVASSSVEETMISADGDCPPCGERAPTPDEFLDMERQIDKMGSCSGVQSALRDKLYSAQISIFTDEAAMDTTGGVWTRFSNDSTHIYISLRHWEHSGLDFEAYLFETLKHEGKHESMYQEGTMDSENFHDAYFNDINTCYAS